MMTVTEVEKLVRKAHAGQTDKIGVPYFHHVRSVADGLAPFGSFMEMAGLLHDVIEDTHLTAEDLHRMGVPPSVVRIVEAVTNVPGVVYLDKIKMITRSPEATLVKISDNAHNSRADRSAQLPDSKRKHFAEKYRAARQELWPTVAPYAVRTVVSIVNPDLLVELKT